MPIVISEPELQKILGNLESGLDVMLAGFSVDTRRVSDMAEFYCESADPLSDPVVYEVFSWPDDGGVADLLVTITVLHAGRVGNEPFHTKGHFHKDPDGPEFVLGYQGTGALQTGDRHGAVHEVELARGTHVWVPSGMAHRVVNRTSESIVYLSISSSAVGHDYDSVAQLHWKQDIVKEVRT